MIVKNDLSGLTVHKAIDFILDIAGNGKVLNMSKCGDDCLAVRLEWPREIIEFQLSGLSPALVAEFIQAPF